jgi:hypothetical protein
MKRLFTFLSLVLCVYNISAATFYSKGNLPAQTAANWNSATNGTGTDAVISDFTSLGNIFVVQTGNTMTASAAWVVTGSIQVEGTLVVNSGITIKVGENFTSTLGTLSGSSATTTSTIEFNGTALQNVSLGTTTNAVSYIVNNNSGINLSGTMTIRAISKLIITSTSSDPVSGSGIVSYTGNTSSLSNMAILQYTNTNVNSTITDKVWPTTNGPNAVSITNSNTGSTTPNHKAIMATSGSRTLNASTTQTVLTMTQSALDIGNNDLIIGKNATITGGAIAFVITSGTGYMKVYYNSAQFTSFTFNIGTETGLGVREYSECYLTYSTAFSATSFIGIRAVNTIIPGDAPGTDHVKRHWVFKHETDDLMAIPAPTGTAFSGTGTYKMDLKGPSATDLVGTIGNVRLFRYDGAAYSQVNSSASGSPTYTVGTFTGTFPAMNIATMPLNAMSYTGRTYLGQQTYTWNGSVSSEYTTATNWTPTRSSVDAADILNFDGAVTPNATVNNIAAETIGKLVFVNNVQATLSGSNSITTGGGTATGTVDAINIAAGSKLTWNSTAALSLSCPTTATTKTATINGELEISGANVTISSVSSPSVTFGSNSKLTVLNSATGVLQNSSLVTVTFVSGHIYTYLRISGTLFPSASSFASGSTINVGTLTNRLTSSPSITLPNAASFVANFNLYLNNSTNSTISLNAAIIINTPTFNIDNSNVGTVTLSGSSTNTWSFSQPITFNSAIRFSAGTSTAAAAFYTFNNGVTFAIGVTDNGTSSSSGYTTVAVTGKMTLNSGATLKTLNTTTGHNFLFNLNGDFETGSTSSVTANTAGTSNLNFAFLKTTGDQIFTPAGAFTSTASNGKINITINKAISGNVVLGASLTTVANLTFTKGKLVMGNFNAAFNASPSGLPTGGWFVTDGTGALTLNSVPSATGKKFFVGSSLTSYDPVLIIPTTASSFTVRVSSSFTNPLRNGTLATTKEWNITTSGTPGNTSIDLKPDDALNSTPASPRIGRYASGAWTELVATLVGSGTPFTATTGNDFAYASNAFIGGLYGVGAQGAFAPINLTSAATGNFTAPASWTPALAPASVDVLTVVSGHNITLDAAASVKDLILTSGTIDLGANDLTITNSLTAVGSLTNHITTSGVGKLVQSVGAGASKTFPVGTSIGSYDPVTVTPTNATLFSVNVKPAFTNAVIDVLKVVNAREWDVSATGAGSTVMGLTADASLTPPTGAADVIGHYNGGWNTIDVTGVTRVGNTYTGTNAGGLFSPFGVGIVGGFTVVLAVELKKLTAYANGKINKVEWSTASEKNMKEYIVERSADGINAWAAFTTQAAINKDDSKYSVEDASALALSFYRIKSVDRDGKEEMSKIVSVKRDTKGKLNISKAFPNPTVEAVQVDFETTTNSNVTVTMTDVLGRVVSSQKVQAVEGLNRLDVNLNAVAKGIYILTLQEGSNVVTQRIVKQ